MIVIALRNRDLTIYCMPCHSRSCSKLSQEMIEKNITEECSSMAVSFEVIAQHFCDRKTKITASCS